VNKFPKLERLNYFNGRILSADDFKLEQSYFIDKQRLHNRYLHGWGIVSGLDVSIKAGKVHVEPGVAIDCAGNEIYQHNCVDIAVLKGASECYVVVEYCEIETTPIPIIGSTGDVGQTVVVNTRIQEGCKVYLVRANPNLKHAKIGPGTCGCGKLHPMAIAHLQKGARGWKLQQCGRRIA
jgi:hypothetical protein